MIYYDGWIVWAGFRRLRGFEVKLRWLFVFFIAWSLITAPTFADKTKFYRHVNPDGSVSITDTPGPGDSEIKNQKSETPPPTIVLPPPPTNKANKGVKKYKSGTEDGVTSYSDEPPNEPAPLIRKPPAPVPVPASPTGVGATAGDKEIILKWNPVPNAGAYLVYYSPNPAELKSGKKMPAEGTSATLKGLANGTTYYFSVSAVNALGESLPSGNISATPVAPIKLAPPEPVKLSAVKTAPVPAPMQEAKKSIPQKAVAEDLSEIHKIKLSLDKFRGSKVMELKCVEGADMIAIPLPDRWDIRSAKVTLSYAHSSSLIPAVSQLMLRVNDQVVLQAHPDPEDLEKTKTITLPKNLLRSDYNDFNFEASQHFLTKDCERPCDGALWTRVNLDQSYLELEYTLKPVPLDLGNLTYLFDPKLITDGKVNFVIKDFSEDTMSVAGTVASGVAKKFNYRKVAFSTSHQLVQNMDNILIGDTNMVAPLLEQYGISIKTNLPKVQVMPLPVRIESTPQGDVLLTDPTHALLVITGKDGNHLRIAANTFAAMNFPYPGTAEMTINEFHLPDITLYAGKGIIQTEKVYKFKALDFSTHTFRGMQPAQRELGFRLPVDFLVRPNDYAKLALNFTYGAGMRPDAVFNVLLNGQHVRSIGLTNANGDLITGYKMDLPTYLFKPGSNTITFAPILTPYAKECELLQPESFFLTVFDNSTFFLPTMPHLIELPQMGLFSINGFPFTRWPDGFGSQIYIPKPDINTLGAALNMMGFMTQRNGYPLLALTITSKQPIDSDRELMIIGDAASIPDEWWKKAPLKLGKISEAPYPATTNWENMRDSSFVTTKQSSGLGPDEAALMEFESPFKRGHTVILLTAANTGNIYALSEALIEPTVFGNVTGDLDIILLTPPDYMVKTMSFGAKYLTGKKGEVSGLDAYLFNNTYLYYVLIFLVLGIPTAVIFAMAKRHKNRGADAEGAPKPKKSIVRTILDFLSKAFFRKGKK